jgi:RNA polymerase sigma-70 factor (ECF subfamily)
VWTAAALADKNASVQVRTCEDLVTGVAAADKDGVILSEAQLNRELERAYPKLFAQAMILAKNRATAEDLVQNTAMLIVQNRHQFRAGTNFGGWASRILRNQFFAMIRDRKNEVDLESVPEHFQIQSGNQEESLELKRVLAQIALLAPDSRDVLIAIAFQGMSYEDLSAQTGLPIGTLKSRVARARDALAEGKVKPESPMVMAQSQLFALLKDQYQKHTPSQIDRNSRVIITETPWDLGPENSWRFVTPLDANGLEDAVAQLNNLPPQQREIVLLTEVAQRTVADIAEHLGSTAEAVTDRLKSAFESLHRVPVKRD